MTTTAEREWLDARRIAASLEISLDRLRRMARRGAFPELLHVDRGEYRVRRVDYEAWERGRMTLAEAARADLQAERNRAIALGRS